MYSIIGATGHVGSAVLNNLKNQNIPAKAVVRNMARATELKEHGVESAIAELHDTESLINAFAGSTGAFIMTPPLFNSDDPIKDHDVMLRALTDALNISRPSKIVYLSSVGAQHQSGTGAIGKLHDMEMAFRQLDIPTVGIRAAWFMENFTGNIDAIRKNGKLMSFIFPTSKAIPMVSARDIGAIAAQLLTEDWDGHRIVELAGPCSYSCDDVAMVFGYLMNKDVSAESVPVESYVSTYRSFGFTNKAAEMMARMNEGFNNDHIVFEGDCEKVEGKTFLEDCLKAYVL